MRLSDILSKAPQKEYIQVDGFLQNKRGYLGQNVKLDVGIVVLNFYCKICDDMRSFYSKGNLNAIFCGKRFISIDCVLSCICETKVEIWFLIESEYDITGLSPRIRIVKKTCKFPQGVLYELPKYGCDISNLLMLADKAREDSLGAGSIIYLRKIYEIIAIRTADLEKIEYTKRKDNNNPRNFRDLLMKVDKKCKIIPTEFSSNRYELFKELSECIHGNLDEIKILSKYSALRRLIIGVLDNIVNKDELKKACSELGWDDSWEGE